MSDTLAVGRIGWWRFNNGDLSDQSGNGRTLTPVGTVNFVPDKDGIENNAVSFLGTRNSLECAYDDSPQNPYISAWVKCVAPKTGAEFLVSIRGTDSKWQGFSLFLSDDFIGWSTYLDRPIFKGTYKIPDDNWHHVLLQYEKSTGKLRLYVDGILRGIREVSPNTTITYNTNINKIRFGAGAASTYQYESNDMLDEVMIGDRVLTGQVDTIGAVATGEIAEIFNMGVNYINNAKPKISEIIFNIDFDKVQLGTYIEIKYLDIKANGVSILDKNPTVKYWNNYNNTVRIFNPEGERFGTSLDLYFQIECDGYETSDVIHKELKMIHIDGYHGDYSGGDSGGGLTNYAYHNNDNYKKSEARILIPLTNTSFISYKK